MGVENIAEAFSGERTPHSRCFKISSWRTYCHHHVRIDGAVHGVVVKNVKRLNRLICMCIFPITYLYVAIGSDGVAGRAGQIQPVHSNRKLPFFELCEINVSIFSNEY